MAGGEATPFANTQPQLSVCRVSVSSLSLPSVGRCVGTGSGLCLPCAPSLGGHLCGCEVNAGHESQPVLWGPLQQGSCSPPHRHPSLGEPRKQQRQEKKVRVGEGQATPHPSWGTQHCPAGLPPHTSAQPGMCFYSQTPCVQRELSFLQAPLP